MADALDQAAETAEEQKDMPATEKDGGAVSASENSAEASNSDDLENISPLAEKPEMPETAETQKPSPPPTEPEPKPEVAAPPKAKVKSKNIPMPDRNEDAPPLDAAEHPPVTVNGRYVVYPSMALKELNSPQAMAYAAEDRREPGRQVFALVCKPGLPTRTHLMRELKGQRIGGLLLMIDFGPVFWHAIDQTTIVVIYERPLGGRFVSSFGDSPPRVNEYELGRLIVDPVAQAVSELTSMDFAHRAIRLDNLFFIDKEKTELVLGECVTAPPGYDQPLIYEPIERAYAMPAGRGEGMSYDDMYALGITAIFALLGFNPVAKYADDELLAGKAEYGSYQCMCGNERIPLPLIEPLRGLLSDEEFERWNTEALENWLNGQKKTPIQRRPAPKPKTAFKFGGRDIRTSRAIAHAFSKNVKEAVKIIKNGKLEQWLRSSLGDSDLADSVAGAITIAKVHESSPDGSDDVLVSKVCMRLDPHGPIRYKNFSFQPDGFGAAMAMEYLRTGNFQLPAEILARDLVSYWVACQENRTPDVNVLEKTYQTLRGFARIAEMGYGMERCLYELNTNLPCQSELLRSAYVGHVDDFLTAIDEVADKVDTHDRPMDKHIAAYIATHFKHDITPHLKAISDSREETSLIGILSLYALMQWRAKTPTLFGLSSWLGGLLSPAIGTYHSRTTRRRIETEIPSLVRQGSLPELFDLIDNAERRQIDAADFEEAQIAFAHAETEIDSVIGEGVDQEKLALQSGEKATAIMALVLSMLATTVIIFVQSV
ncbi:MAG: hypothetical protein OQK24_11945 [Magnetovibrio sp.]|nr:hypothetical protein [Magnetovibrio sp.]